LTRNNSKTEIENQIYRGFTERLSRLEIANNRYETIAIKQWNSNDWVGFYQFLDIEPGLAGWSYVPNQSGGFWCAVLDWPYWNGFPVHYQIEEGRICFKICFDPGETDWGNEAFDRNAQQDNWQSIILNSAKGQFPELKRPYHYMHRGTNRTVVTIDQKAWLGNQEDMLDKAVVIDRLKSYKTFIKSVVESTRVLPGSSVSMNKE
jgi:hypothetical protein